MTLYDNIVRTLYEALYDSFVRWHLLVSFPDYLIASLASEMPCTTGLYGALYEHCTEHYTDIVRRVHWPFISQAGLMWRYFVRSLVRALYDFKTLRSNIVRRVCTMFAQAVNNAEVLCTIACARRAPLQRYFVRALFRFG